MNVEGMTVIRDALALQRMPDLAVFAAVRRQRLPTDLRPLLRILAGNVDATVRAERLVGEPAHVLREAAVLYVQQILFENESDSYRTLGVNSDASNGRIKEHYRLLARWLHPDRNADGWEVVYFYRINAAWQNLRNASRRQSFDRRQTGITEAAADAVWGPRIRRHPEWIPESTNDAAPTRSRRNLTAWILRGVAAICLIALATFFGMQRSEVRPPTAAVVAFEPAAREMPPAETGSAGASPVKAVTAKTSRPVDLASPIVTSELPVETSGTVEEVSHRLAEAKPDVSGDASLDPVVEVAPARPIVEAADSTLDPLVQIPTPVVASSETSLASAYASNSSGPQSVLIDEAQTQVLIRRFITAYETGDLDRLAHLLTRESSDDADGRDAILREYRRLFRSSNQRRIRISAVSWIEQSDTSVIIASFDASIVGRGESTARQVSGDIRFDLRREDGDLRIYRIRHERYGS